MAFAKKNTQSGPSVILTIGVLVVVAISALVLSGNFASVATPFAPLLKPFASSTKAKITQTYIDAFKTDEVDTEKWKEGKSGDTVVRQTAANNLRIDVPAGAVNNKPKSGNLTFKEVFKENGDFRVFAVVYRPVVTGEGTGVTGVRFASIGSADDEGAVVQWVVNGDKSRASFVVRAADGTKLESQAVELKTNVAVLRLDRVNKQYRAYYKFGSDLTADAGWKALGSEQNSTLGNDGHISLFTNNVGSGGKFPKVQGRFDTVHIGWEGKPAIDDKISFSDAFADAVIAKGWSTKATAGATAAEKTSDNLVMAVPAGAPANKPGHILVTRNWPVVQAGKDFTLNTRMFKPTVTGEGTGVAGISFRSAGAVDDEAAQMRWVVGAGLSRLVFLVRNPDGTLAERATANVTANKLTLRLVRRGDKYVGWYRTGDSDTDWVQLGKEETSAFGANGVIGLFASNMGAAAKYPRVVARFDQASGSVAK